MILEIDLLRGTFCFPHAWVSAISENRLSRVFRHILYRRSNPVRSTYANLNEKRTIEFDCSFLLCSSLLNQQLVLIQNHPLASALQLQSLRQSVRHRTQRLLDPCLIARQ